MAQMREGDGRTALVTGSSAGIGEALANVWARHGFNLVLTARREDRLIKVAEDIKARHGVQVSVIAEDLADPVAPQRLADRLAAENLTIDVLINNAGYGVGGKFHTVPWDDHAKFFQVLMVAPCALTHLLLPGMLQRRYGRVVNIASVAGLLPGSPGFTLYGGSKSHIIRFSQALNAECRGTGVHVTAINPGLTRSEFHEAAGVRSSVDAMPGWMWQTAEEVALEAYAASRRNKPVHTTGRVNRAMGWLARHLPQGLVSKLSQGRMNRENARN